MILGIETSCDETSVAVYHPEEGIRVNFVASQVNLFKMYGGVIPEVACRRHLEVINPLIDQVLEKAGIKWEDISACAVCYGPGLIGAVLIGVAVAKAIAGAIGIPLIGINHLEAHIYSSFLEASPKFPLLALIVSGGHTNLVYMQGHLSYKTLGQTKDDAVGEAFDKVAKLMGLEYPGGPVIDRLSKKGDPLAIDFPKPYLKEGGFDFSFSGLKTAVRNYYFKNKDNIKIEDVCASFQNSAVEVLVSKLFRAADDYNAKQIIICGGVASNSFLREKISLMGKEKGYSIWIPGLEYCTDNAAMVACAGFYKYRGKNFASLDLDAYSVLDLDN